MTTAERVEAYRFMRAHAGYVVGWRAQSALDLARAEQLLGRACDAGVASVEWVDDFEPIDWDDGETAAAVEAGELVGPCGCVLRVDGEVAASLWGIVLQAPTWEGDDPYTRVVAAELACEVDADLRQACGDALDSALLVEARLAAAVGV